MENIVTEIKEFISKKSRIPMNELSDSTEIFNSGVISSLGVLELIIHMEKKFNVQMEGDELSSNNMKDIKTLASFISAKVAS